MDDAGQPIQDHNVYGAPPGSGITLPPGYLPTPSVKNKNNYFPQSEPLGDDEMRITFMGSQPWPPRLAQAGTSIMVECGSTKRLFFDFGPGCIRNIIANQVPVAEINDIFITHLHIDHFADLLYLWQFAPFNGRYVPLRVYGPSGRTPDLGTKAVCDHLQAAGNWTKQPAVGMPVESGFQYDVTEFDFRDDGGVVYDQDGVRVIHWRRSHAVDGASAYRLDWNGLSFVWTGDGKPDKLTAKYAAGCDVFVTELAIDMVNLWAIKQGVAPMIGGWTIDTFHTTHYGYGYLANLVQPRLAMATHVSFDRELVGEMVAGVRVFYKGMFGFGIDNTVVNITKDKIWMREAAVPETGNCTRPDPMWTLQNQFGGKIPEQLHFSNRVLEVQEQEVRDLEIDPRLFTPPDQVRDWVRTLPETLSPADFFTHPGGDTPAAPPAGDPPEAPAS